MIESSRRYGPLTTRNVMIVAVVSLLAFFVGSPLLRAQTSPVGLGTADGFAVLAGTTITNTGPTTITGDVGLHPGTAVTGFDSVTLNGALHVTDAVAEQAKVDLVTAYNDAAGRTPATTVSTELGGQTLTQGIYNSADGTFGITGTLTIDAQGDPNAVFVFQAASTLITASASTVNLINGASACNVFWQVGSSATLGTTSSFRGNILALTSITLNTGATIEGRALARNGAVTLDTNTITGAACITSSPTTTTTVAGTTTTTVAGTTTTTLAPPSGGVDTGGGSTSGGQATTLLVGGAALLTAAAGVFEARRRLSNRRSDQAGPDPTIGR